MSFRSSADKPKIGDAQYHIGLSEGQMPRYVLVPGDVERSEKIASTWSEHRLLAKRREYVSYRGTYKGCGIGVMSTGIGGPAVSIAVEELARIGVDTLIRVGSCGTVRSDVKLGDIVVTTGAARFDGASKIYAPEGYPAVSDFRVVSALVSAAESLGVRYHLGITASFDGFYVGQGRPGFRGYLPEKYRNWVQDLASLRVMNVEMEAATLLTMANVYALRAGAVCAVFANRVTNEFSDQGEEDAIAVANEAVKILSEHDSK
ncbi:MAG: uridine phosphorylase [Thermoprotei archaeon]